MTEPVSNVGDLTALCHKIETLISEELHVEDKPSIVIAFSLPPDYQEFHWVTNVSRADGIKVMKATAEKMTAQTN